LMANSRTSHESSHIQYGMKLKTLKNGIVLEGFRSSDSCLARKDFLYRFGNLVDLVFCPE
jgi:hypothetical protein